MSAIVLPTVAIILLIVHLSPRRTKLEVGGVNEEVSRVGVNEEVSRAGDGYNINERGKVFLSKADPFEVDEGCLSLEGLWKVTRYKEIEVEFEDINFKKQRQRFTGFTAQIVQHEVDHLEGILI